jgi:hypothetical protein
MNRTDSLVPIAIVNPWIALHRSSLVHHLDQCVPRGAGHALDRGVEALHSMLSRHFLTTVCSAAALLIVPLVWFG